MTFTNILLMIIAFLLLVVVGSLFSIMGWLDLIDDTIKGIEDEDD